jgi:glutamyl-tRNA synthetase
MLKPYPVLKTRLAPTPSGYLHFGNACSFVLTWLLARHKGGSLLLRIDDVDNQRFRPAYLDHIFRTIDLLGIDYDEGPSGPDDFTRNWSQLKRLDLYHDMLHELQARELLYPCGLSRQAISSLQAEGQFPAAARAQTKPSATECNWRARVPEPCPISIPSAQGPTLDVDLFTAMPDFVLWKKDGLPAYQLVSLADDLYFNIDYIVRGEDLLASSAAQCWLANELNASAFQAVNFWHHGLITHPDGQKLSKSAGDQAVFSDDISQHKSAVFAQAARWLNLELGENLSLAECLAALQAKG